MDNSGVALVQTNETLIGCFTVPVLTVEQMFCVNLLTHSVCIGSAFTSM